MPGEPQKDDENLFLPPWETEDEESLEPPGPPRARKQPSEPDYAHPLLIPLVRAQNAVARLQAKTEVASDVVAEGLRARMSYLEAAGWLNYTHFSIHPWDLALRDRIAVDNRPGRRIAGCAFGSHRQRRPELRAVVAAPGGISHLAAFG